MNKIVKLEPKTQDECIYFLSGGHLTTHTVQTRKRSVNTINLNKIKCNSVIDRNGTSSINEFTLKRVLHRYKTRHNTKKQKQKQKQKHRYLL